VVRTGPRSAIVSTAAPCPPWLKRAWIEQVGPEQIVELYAMTEGVGGTLIRGDEWLTHPGSVGRGTICDVRILDPDGCDLSAGEARGLAEMVLRDPIPAAGSGHDMQLVLLEGNRGLAGRGRGRGGAWNCEPTHGHRGCRCRRDRGAGRRHGLRRRLRADRIGREEEHGQTQKQIGQEPAAEGDAIAEGRWGHGLVPTLFA